MNSQVTAILLAGGESRRMGGMDKALLQWPPASSEPIAAPRFEESLLQHSLDRIGPQVQQVIVSSNLPLKQQSAGCRQRGFTVVPDLPPFVGQGPLAGLLSAGRASSTEWLCLLPVDTPYLPDNWVSLLWTGRADQQLIVAHDGKRQQHAVLLMHRQLLDTVESALLAGQRGLYRWLQNQSAKPVYFPDSGVSFANINSPADWAMAAARRSALDYPVK